METDFNELTGKMNLQHNIPKLRMIYRNSKYIQTNKNKQPDNSVIITSME